MARRKGPKKTNRYPDEFKIKAIQLAGHPDILAKDVAEDLSIHPILLYRWRKEYREGKFKEDKRRYWFASYQGSNDVQKRINETLRQMDFEPVLFKKRIGRKKGVDIALTMNILTNAFNQNYDIGILFAGDEDYVELVKEVKRCESNKVAYDHSNQKGHSTGKIAPPNGKKIC